MPTTHPRSPPPHRNPHTHRRDLSTTEQLHQLAAAWPIGAKIQHRERGWTGHITPDPKPDIPAATI